MTAAVPEEARTGRRSSAGGASKERLRLWLRLLRASRGIEAEVRERLRLAYDITLPQFDVMAALARRSDGITMTELSRYLMVSNGNVTGIVDRLVKDGLVERRASEHDRRATVVRLSDAGATAFAEMAAAHEGWVAERMGALDRSEVQALIGQLDRLIGRKEETSVSPQSAAAKTGRSR